MKIFVTSDLHFGHNNIMKYEHRPFNSLEEMNNALIFNWNHVVGKDDLVYILGDFAFLNVEKTELILKQLNGQKVLVRGNHDEFVNKQTFNRGLFQEIVDYKELEYHGKIIIMCHYPLAVWNCQHHGSIHLFGHIHSNILSDHPLKEIQPNSYNVGVDVNHYTPVLLDDIINLMRKLENPENYIPKKTCYCYDENGKCPFWDSRENVGSQNYGYCHYLKTGDYELNIKYNNESKLLEMDENGELQPIDNTVAEEFWEQFPSSLLWDACKECGIDDDWDFDEENEVL